MQLYVAGALVVVTIVALAIVSAVLGVVMLRKPAADAALASAIQEKETLEQRVQALARFQAVLDADAHARSLVESAQQRVAEVTAAANHEAKRTVEEGKAQASALVLAATANEQRAASESDAARAQAKTILASAQTSAEQTIGQSVKEARQIVEEAKKQAHETAGEAYAAMQNVKKIEATAKAMENVIYGYGDRYLVPTFSLLDELAEQFGFAEGGQRLKASRERMRQMIREGQAADCDYKETKRRATAIRFVLDAFNGKVDTVLADVRDDNVGTLAQMIRDAAALVNKNGEAFLNARITDEYLDARLDELRWAVITQALRQKEREEQREIKERIREEEKVQRELDKVIRDTEKEEDSLRKAMEKARRDIEKASDEQKAKYEAQLADLMGKLQAAEDRNKRALSMAQQTKAGHVYVISNIGSFGEHVYKIGMTRRLEPLDRVRELGDASVPFEFDVHAMIKCDDAPAIERQLQKRFVKEQVNKVNPRKEFFRVELALIRLEAEQLGCQTSWTVLSECRHWKETQAIEKAMLSNQFDEKAWEKQQIEGQQAEAPAAASSEE